MNAVAKLQPVPFRALAGWSAENFSEAFATFEQTCRSILDGRIPPRQGQPAPDLLVGVCRKAAALGTPKQRNQFRQYFEANFQPYLVIPRSGESASPPGFLTGYYEPEVPGSLTKTIEFSEPLLGLPENHVVLQDSDARDSGFPKDLTTAIRTADGALKPYPAREAIAGGKLGNLAPPLVWVRDGIEAFMIHVQGSARIRLPNGKILRAKYAGRNGHPYTSIGRVLVERYNISPDKMSMKHLKRWVRTAGQRLGQPGRRLMEENRSFIFFSLDRSLKEDIGPVGASGVNLTALRSIAIDRTIWPYGLPYWIEADLPWRTTDQKSPLRRLMIGQDTGSAILGPARADIFFGSGTQAGALAGAIRHGARFHVLLPK
ncbi:MAG: MltA domain-containing protein [Hyphomicrobiales bacterium]|nr:MltA domain-containing protein [Hyphomicrobiales bacterium]